MTNPIVLWARARARRLGIVGLLGRLNPSKDYEAAYWNALAGMLREGDCVWDVGANVGYYTMRFADVVGRQGRVVAFEPSPSNFARLQANVGGRSSITLVPMGLSSEAGPAWMRQGEDDLGATSSIAGPQDRESGRVEQVQLERGDRLIQSGAFPAPNVIKVDVEGHEAEVIGGLSATLRHPALRAIFVEMHFAVLSARGRSNVPREIEQTLGSAGFEIKWTDPSHLYAMRPMAAADEPIAERAGRRH